jgi:hypothetical protein
VSRSHGANHGTVQTPCFPEAQNPLHPGVSYDDDIGKPPHQAELISLLHGSNRCFPDLTTATLNTSAPSERASILNDLLIEGLSSAAP